MSRWLLLNKIAWMPALAIGLFNAGAMLPGEEAEAGVPVIVEDHPPAVPGEEAGVSDARTVPEEEEESSADQPPPWTSELIELDIHPRHNDYISPARARERGRDLITVSLDDVPVQDVVRMFSRVSQANIIAGTNLQGRVTVSLQEVEWEPALRAILSSVGLGMVEKEEGIFRILSQQELAREPVTVDTLFLQFTTVSNVLPVVRHMLVSTNAAVSGLPSANAIVVQETATHLGRIKEMVKRLDIPRSQVFIEAKFVELNDEAIQNLGINWQSLAGYRLAAENLRWSVAETRDWRESRISTLSEFDRRSNLDAMTRNYDMFGTPSIPPQGPSTDPSGRGVHDTIDRGRSVELSTEDAFIKEVADMRTAILTADDFAVTLSALREQMGTAVVSNPKIIVASGETASIHVGVEEPNIRSEYSAEANQYTYFLDGFIPIGVKVEVTPVVNTEDSISVRIVPELSDKIGDVPVGDGRVTFPRTRTRRVATDFDLPSGRTVAIGGLTQSYETEDVTKIPVLGDIPLLGRLLFRHTSKRNMQDEVIIFVTVSLAGSDIIREESGIPAEGRLIHRHLIMQRNNGGTL